MCLTVIFRVVAMNNHDPHTVVTTMTFILLGVPTVSLRIKVVELRSRDSRRDPKLKVARVPPGSRRGTAKVALRS